MNKSEIIIIMICFHFNSYRNFQHYYKLIPIYDRLLLRKRSVIETINDELKNVAQLVHSRHRSGSSGIWSDKIDKIKKKPL